MKPNRVGICLESRVKSDCGYARPQGAKFYPGMSVLTLDLMYGRGAGDPKP